MDILKGAVSALRIVALAHLIAWHGAGNRGGYILQSTDCK